MPHNAEVSEGGKETNGHDRRVGDLGRHKTGKSIASKTWHHKKWNRGATKSGGAVRGGVKGGGEFRASRTACWTPCSRPLSGTEQGNWIGS